jgi:hypothetical protein
MACVGFGRLGWSVPSGFNIEPSDTISRPHAGSHAQRGASRRVIRA